MSSFCAVCFDRQSRLAPTYYGVFVSKVIRRKDSTNRKALWWALALAGVGFAGVAAMAWWRGGPVQMREVAVSVNSQQAKQVIK